MPETGERLSLEMLVKAPAEAVFQSLTEPTALQYWFCEHAEVSLEAGQYDFWGRFTPETSDRESGRHRLTALEPDSRLEYTWPLYGTDTSVEFILKSAPEGTWLLLSHRNLAPRQPGRVSFADFWSLSLENLRAWVQQTQIGLRSDFAEPARGDLELSIDIEANSDAVFDALINPDQLERYLASEVTVEPKVGGQYQTNWGCGPVRILELEPPEKLTYAWSHPDQPRTKVTWSLEETDLQTHLTLVHSGFAPDADTEDYRVGWLTFLNRIKFMVEGGMEWQAPLALIFNPTQDEALNEAPAD